MVADKQAGRYRQRLRRTQNYPRGVSMIESRQHARCPSHVVHVALSALAIAACSRSSSARDVAIGTETSASATASITAPVARSLASAAVGSAEPPRPGRFEVVFTGAYDRRVEADGASCDDMWFRSTDLLGPDEAPRWTLLEADGSLVFQLGPLETMEAFRLGVKDAGKRYQKTNDAILLDVDLVATDGKKVHAKGRITCAQEAKENRVPESVRALLAEASGKPVRRFSSTDFGRAENKRPSSAVVPEHAGPQVVAAVRGQLPKGWVAFVGTTRWLGEEKHAGEVEVVVGPARDQFDIVRLARTDAVNYDMGTEALYKKLRAIHDVAPIDILHAETDTITFRFIELPADVPKMAQTLYAFCPDIVDQGAGTVAALADSIRETRRVTLWWD